MDMDTKFIKPAQMFLCVILFLSLFVPYYLIKSIDEDNVTQVDVTASATSAWAVDDSFVFEDWMGVGSHMRYKPSQSEPYASEAATIAYSSGSYSYAVTSTTNTYGDSGWGLSIPTAKKVHQHLKDDGATDLWVNFSMSATNNDVRGTVYVRAFGEYDDDVDQHEYVNLGSKRFSLSSANLNTTMRFKYRSNPQAYADALALCQRWDKDVQMAIYIYFSVNANPDASDTLLITLDTEDVDENENVPTKLAGLLVLVGVFYFVVAFAMTSEFNPLGEVLKKLKPSVFFLVLLAAVALVLAGTGTVAAGDTNGENDDGDDPHYGLASYVAFICLAVVGALCGFSCVKGAYDLKNIGACLIGAVLFLVVGFWLAFDVMFIIALNPEFNFLTGGVWVFVAGFLAITGVAIYNYAQGKDEVWSE